MEKKKLIKFKHCNLVFSKTDSDYGCCVESFYFERPGYEKVEFDLETLACILNSLMECQSIINSDSIVESSCQLMTNGNRYTSPEIYLLTTKINDKIRISLLGFSTDSERNNEKIYEIKFDKTDDVFHACGEFLRYLHLTKQYKAGLMLL
jgi:hypothetical protein